MVLNLTTVDQLLEELLDRGYEQTTNRVLKAIAASTNTTGTLIQRRLKELDAEVETLQEAGEKLAPDNPVLRSLVSDLVDVLKRNSQLINNASGAVQANGAQAAGQITRQLALPGLSDEALRLFGVEWNQPDPEAVNRLVGYVDSPAWADELFGYSIRLKDVVHNQSIRGIVEGWNPVKTAREIRRLSQDLPVAQANNLMRTLHLQSYRTGTSVHQNSNQRIIQRVIRVAALDDRTCLACIALSGTVIWDSERDAGTPIPRVNDHHSGRCTSLTDVFGRPLRNIPSGQDWFNGLDESRKRAIAGPGKLAALKSGQATLDDFVATYQDPVFDEMIREQSLKGVLNPTP